MKHLVIATILVIASSIWLIATDQSPPSKAAILIASTYLILAALVLITKWILRNLRLLRSLLRQKLNWSRAERTKPHSIEAAAQAAKPSLTESRKIEIASAAVSSGIGLAAFAAANGIKESSLREWVSTYLGQDSNNDNVTPTKIDLADKIANRMEQDDVSVDEESDDSGENAALELEFSAAISCRFPECESLDDGSLYIAAIQIGSTVLFDNTLERNDVPYDGTFIPSSFWESEISYEYERDTIDEYVWTIRISGSLAAEFDKVHLVKSGLGGFDAEVAISSLAVSWAEDGDSPKHVCEDPDLEECDVTNLNVIEEFVEYP